MNFLLYLVAEIGFVRWWCALLPLSALIGDLLHPMRWIVADEDESAAETGDEAMVRRWVRVYRQLRSEAGNGDADGGTF